LYTNACICEYDDSNMSPQEKGDMDWSLLCVVTSVLWLDECGEQGVIQKACSCDLDVLCNKDPCMRCVCVVACLQRLAVMMIHDDSQ
jgi:hypothetical protein